MGSLISEEFKVQLMNSPANGIIQPVLIFLPVAICVAIDVDGHRSIGRDVQVVNPGCALELVVVLLDTNGIIDEDLVS